MAGGWSRRVPPPPPAPAWTGGPACIRAGETRREDQRWRSRARSTHARTHFLHRTSELHSRC
eukprot:15056889-Alexandrium_andersonii.AAC.1